MNARDGKDLTERPGGRRTSRPRRGPLAAALLALLVLCCFFGAAASAGASAAPGKPTAKAPKGAINTTKPTFKWSRAPRAHRYQVRVYKGTRLLLKKTGITRLSWKCSRALPRGVYLTWKVRGRNAAGNGAWSKRLRFKVRGNRKAITAFSFSSPAATGVIDQTLHTIALTVPHGTNLTKLVATFTTTGASVKVGSTLQTSGTTANDFRSPVTYTVTAANASTQVYVVTVTVASSPAAKAITAFSFQGLAPAVIGSIKEGTHTIALTVPHGTNLTKLVATFATTGASVKVGSTLQTSGTTANDFRSPVTYTVTAANASTRAYVVTVTVAPLLTIGQSYFGGKVTYILQSGDPGYDANVQHGLIAATADQSRGIRWSNGTSVATGATATELGTGFANTNLIIAVQGATATSYAAGLARAYNGGGYADWYLPSQDELNKLYLSKAAIGGFASGAYWTSSEYEASTADNQYFNDGHTDGDAKDRAYRVRAVRVF